MPSRRTNEEETSLLRSESSIDEYGENGFTATTGYKQDYNTWRNEQRAKEKLEARTRWFVYISHFLSAWSDRMWSFGVGIFLVQFEPISLRLVAIYGFANGGAILLLGAIVGDWVDKTSRLSAAKATLVIQNLSVCLCSILVFFVFEYHAEIKEMWPEQGLADLSYAVIIIISIIGNLASEGRKIAVERDWIVVICGRDKDLLASMTSFLRSIDLTTLILAPVVTGQIIAFTVIGYGALFIAGWNLVSVVIEYVFILKVYEKVPALRAVKNKDRESVDEGPSDKDSPLMNEGEEQITANEDLDTASSPRQQNKDPLDLDETSLRTETAIKSLSADDKPEDSSCRGSCGSCLGKVFKSFIILYRGWSTYMKYDVAFAGLGLSMLYMTVLGFDNITTGYAISQGISESILGFLMAAGAIVGILGTIAYPHIRKRIGLQRTGLFGIATQILVLTLCVAAVWAPGSPFDLLYDSRVPKGEIISNQCENSSIINTNETFVTNGTSLGYNFTSDFNLTNQSVICNGTEDGTNTGPESYISISLLMGGIIGARFGLWIADLTITQLFLEAVNERERGIVNGVQSSLNQCADMLKFLMVIVAPQPEVFGILILVSFAFICIGWLFYAKYSRSARGHLFHFEKVSACLNSKQALPVTDMTERGTDGIHSRS